MFHTPEFRRRERLYRNLTRAERWIGENMPALLRARTAMSAAKKAGEAGPTHTFINQIAHKKVGLGRRICNALP